MGCFCNESVVGWERGTVRAMEMTVLVAESGRDGRGADVLGNGREMY